MLSDPDPVAVGLVEPQTLIREAIRALLDGAEGLQVVADADSVSNFAVTLQSLRVDVILLAIDDTVHAAQAMPDDLSELCQYHRVIVLTSRDDSSVHARAVECGAMGVVGKNQAAAVLFKAIQKVCAGEMWLDRARTAGVIKRLVRAHFDHDPEAAKVEALTPREREIVALVAEGLRNKDIAERLFISEATARNHLTSILDKLELSDRFQLAVYAFRRGLVVAPQTSETLRMSAAMNGPVSRRSSIGADYSRKRGDA